MRPSAKAMWLVSVLAVLPIRPSQAQDRPLPAPPGTADANAAPPPAHAQSPAPAAEKSLPPPPPTPSTPPMNPPDTPLTTRVTGIGGVFIKAKDPAALRAWYKKHLGIDVQAWGGASFRWVDAHGTPANGTTAWFVGAGENFAPSTSPFMINYRVADLRGLLKALREEGCQVLDDVQESEYGVFGWVMDPEGNKIELWQPPAGQ